MQPVQDRTDTNIGDYLVILRRRWKWVAGTVILAVALVLIRDFAQAPVYRSSAQLLLQSKQSESIFQPGTQVVSPERTIENELKIIKSRTVKEAAQDAYDGPVAVNAQSGGEDDVIILSATDTKPAEAARKVNVYAETYQTERLNAIVADLAKAKLVLQQQIDDFQAQVDAVNAPLADLDNQLLLLSPDDPQFAALSQERSRVAAQTQSRREELESQLSDYQQRLQILQLSERLSTTGGVQILNPATPNGTPVSPTPIRDAVQAALIGLFLGLGLAFVREQLDDSIRDTSDLERAVRSVPVIGLIPFDEEWKNPREERLNSQATPMSATAEAFRSLRTTLQYLALERPMGVVQVTSASAGEGKSSALSNLAIAFAQAGRRVVVVGSDLRKPRLHRFFDVDGSVGLTSVLLGEVELDQAVQQSPVSPNIWVLPSGPRPPNPSELLSLDRTASLIRSLSESYGVVFIDSPPVLPVTDALVLSRCVDATVFLATSNRTRKGQAKRAVELLEQVNSPLVGTILNGVSAENAYGSLYEYYGYVQPSKQPIASRFRLRRKNRGHDTPFLETSVLPDEEYDQTTSVSGNGAHAATQNKTASGTDRDEVSEADVGAGSRRDA